VVHNRETTSFSRLFQLTVVLAWIVGLWCLCTSVGGAPPLEKFLRPDYAWIVHMGAAILVLFLIALVYCDPHHGGRRGIGLLLQTTIMLLPLLYLPMAVRSEFSPEAARKRSVSIASPDSSLHGGSRFRDLLPDRAWGKERPAPNLPDEPSLVQLITERNLYSGKSVTTVGKVCLDDRLPENTFFCYRLLMICCAADAKPIGVLVHHDKIETLKDGSWVKVTGVVGLSSFQEHSVVKIAAAHVDPTDPPKVPYVWP
jgi:putative membrane protein